MRTAKARSPSGSDTVLLYRIIFTSRAVFASVLLLAISILLQPVDFVYAEESDATTPGEAAETVESPDRSEETETSGGESAAEEADGIGASGDNAEETTEAPPEEADTPDEGTGDTSIIPAGDEEPAGPEEGQEAGTQEPVPDDQTSTDTSSSSTDSDQTGETIASSSPAEPIPGAEEPTATSAPETTSPTAPPSSLATSTSTSTSPDQAEEDTAASTSSEPVSGMPTGGSGGGDSTSGEDEETATTSEPATPDATTTATASIPISTDTPAIDTTVGSDQETGVAAETGIEGSVDGGGNSTTEPAAATTTATTAPATTQPVVVSTVNNSMNRHQFGEADCVSVGDGSYYCSKDRQVLSPGGDQIYAAEDADGDREIFLTTTGRTVQITKNTLDDVAPEYDQGSDSIVWHRLIGGRYQIMQYDLAKNAEYQLTSGSYNSMEPAIEGNHIAWQYWDGEDWEIVLYDGSETTQLTDNAAPDLSPSINDGYIIWSTVDQSGQPAATVYDIARGTTELIEGVEGGSVMNPRFVLVYDTKFDNGDVITSGYDPGAGGTVHLGALPAELPRHIPDSEPTEEVRALIQNKSPKEESEEVLLLATSSDKAASTSPTASTTGDGPAEQSVRDLDLSTTTDEQFALSEYDVVVTDYSTTSAQVNATGSAANLVE